MANAEKNVGDHEHNSIQASIFKRNIIGTHPSIHSNLNPTQQATHTSWK
jgi:hypothetical protein